MVDPMKLEILKTQEKQEKNKEKEKKEIKQITESEDQIKDENTCEKALAELSHKRESLSDLTLYIWYYRYSSNTSSRNN